MSDSLSYEDPGSDLPKDIELVDRIKYIARSTPRSGVMGEISGFGGLFSLNLANILNPVLVSFTSGVGNKLKIAFQMDKHDTIGIDLVAMSVNQIVAQGAKPLFFHNYMTMGSLENQAVEQIVTGVAKGCTDAGCALIEGQPAEISSLYKSGEYDISGFAVGLVDNDKIIDGSYIRPGHRLIGIASNGIHASGFSMVQKIFFDKCGYTADTYIPEFGSTLGEELLKPTIIYVSIVLSLIRDLPIHGLVHITDGIEKNIIRVIPNVCKAVIDDRTWEIPTVFRLLQKKGNVSDNEMMNSVNNGIGLVAIVPEKFAQEVMDRLNAMKITAFHIGRIISR